MKIENQVCSLKLAKKLKKLGVKQDSFWVWAKDGSMFSDGEIGLRPNHGKDDEYIASAFLSGELGEKLPVAIETKKTSNSSWFCGDKSIQDSRNFRVYRAGKTEAEARGKMLAYLIKNKLQGEPK